MTNILWRAVAAFVFFCGLAHANMGQRPPSQSTGAVPPPQAVAAGYTQLATMFGGVDQGDFTQTSGVDIHCADSEDGHFWYTAFEGILLGNGCYGIDWPAIDPVYGNTALHISWASNNWGAEAARIGLTSANLFATTSHNFPQTMYVEFEYRFPTVGYCCSWYAAWAWWDPNYGTGNEWDWGPEIHGEDVRRSDGSQSPAVGGGAINWDCTNGGGDTCYGGSWIPDPYPGDIRAYHKYGLLVQATDPTTCWRGGPPQICLKTQAYHDDVAVGGVAYTQLCTATAPCDGQLGGTEDLQRNVLILTASVSCGGSEGINGCQNDPIVGVSSDGSGGTLVSLQRSLSNGWFVYKDDVPYKFVGTHTSADGIHSAFHTDDTHLDIPGVRFHGTWSGSGTLNPDPVEMWVKSYRVWVDPNNP